jgi:hypothetical protein
MIQALIAPRWTVASMIENLPSRLMMEQQCRTRYMFPGVQGGQRIPRKWLESGAS